MDPRNPQYSAFPPGGGEHDLFPVGAGVNSVLPTEVGEGAAVRAESECGIFLPGAGRNSASLAGATVNSVLPTGAAVNGTVHSNSEQIGVKVGRGSSPHPAVVLGGPTRIITPLMGTTPALLNAKIETASAQTVDLIEWRVDPLFAALGPASDRRAVIEKTWEETVSQTPLPVLTTIHTAVEGGAAGLSANEYTELVALLAGLANAVDVEITRAGAHSLVIRAHETGAAVIASFHNFNETPPDSILAALYAQVAEAGAGILEVACRITTPKDVLRILTTQIGAHHEHRHLIIGIDMGEVGTTTRIAGAPLSSAATFAFIAASSVPGQFTVKETRRGLDLVEKGRTVEKRKSDEEEEAVDKTRSR